MRKTLIVTVLCLAMMGIFTLLSQFELAEGQLLYSLVSILLFGLGGFFLKKITPGLPVQKFFRIKRPKLRNTFLVVWSMLTIIFGSFLLNFLTSFVCDKLDIEATSSLVYGFSSGDRIITMITLALVPAITEEFFFRGAVVSYLKDKGVSRAVFLSAFLFTLMHGIDIYFLSTFFCGVMLAYVAELTGNIVSTAIIHFFNNFMSYILILYAEKLAIVKMDTVMMWTSLLLFFISAIVLTSVVIRRLKKSDRSNNSNEGERIWEENQPAEN